MTANVNLPDSGESYHKLRRADLSDVPFDRSVTSDSLVRLIESMLAEEPHRPTVDQLLFHPQIGSLVYERMVQEQDDIGI